MTDNNEKPQHTLELERTFEAPVANVWRCWTEPELLKQWFCPAPWHVSEVRMDITPGGEFYTLMNGPNGEQFPNLGVFLAIEPEKRLVTTDAFRPGWLPSERPFMVAEMLFEDAGQERTRYIARAMHWTDEAKQEHEAMGFHEGWGKAADQLEALAKSL